MTRMPTLSCSCICKIYMNTLCVRVAGCLYGGLCCVSQRTTRHTAAWQTKDCIQPTSLCMINIQSKVTSCRGDCRGTHESHKYNNWNKQLSIKPFFLFSVYFKITCFFLMIHFFLLSFFRRVLSALAHWAAIFGEVEYLPLIAFPFVKLFQNNPMLCFEVVATVIGI